MVARRCVKIAGREDGSAIKLVVALSTVHAGRRQCAIPTATQGIHAGFGGFLLRHAKA